MRTVQEVTDHSPTGREIIPQQLHKMKKTNAKGIKITALEAEVLNHVRYFLGIYGFDSVKKFRESFNSILFRVILHPDQVTTEIEDAIQDMQHINRFFKKLEEYESKIGK